LAADLDLEAAERSAELARALGATAHAYQVDVGDTQAMETFAEWVRDTLGVPDVVVSNAGIGMAGPMLDTSPAEWERLLRVNLWSVIDGCRLFGRQMVAANKPGHLVNVASGVAFAPSRNYPAYATSKAAVLMLSECLRAELAGRSIGVTAVCPGFVDTGIVQATRFVGMDAERQARRQAKIQRFYKRRRLSPDTVGEKLVRAVERNKAVVSVGSEVHLGALQWRFAPWATRFLARFDLTS
ncbi:TPA: SDR family NAD(P)-dependent oxidoreductase, partial [Pseudomonas aeruginosa]|nr:SDR family NAD(P)-dependent oxidoreductase [Pseudomonas aeruginosa]